ncbi:MAG TPA: hypothetical protein VN667_19530 [Burkholderiales bacterium]|nr:hypothetical protein [Burkholderiales bacterium]
MNCTEENFRKDISGHVMTVLRADGVNRHIRFKRPGMQAYWFDLLTWPGVLCIDGDCGTYVFKRVEDMFKFFRPDHGEGEPGRLFINPSYWAEKCASQSKFGEGIQRYSPEAFRAAVKADIEAHFEGSEDHEQKAIVMAAAEREVLPYADSEHEAYPAICEFESESFHFVDFFDRRLTDYTFHFIWNLYAIAWGIQQYDTTARVPA